MYDFIYENEKEFKQLERGLKKINMVAYKKLLFEIYPNLKNGNLKQAKKNDNLYEIELPTDKIYEQVYLSKFKLVFKIIDNKVNLIGLLPKELLLASYEDKTTIHKGIIFPTVPTVSLDKYMFAVNLITMLNNSSDIK